MGGAHGLERYPLYALSHFPWRYPLPRRPSHVPCHHDTWQVRMAFERYAAVSGEELVSAVTSFLATEIAAAAAKTSSLFGDANAFRSERCYLEKVDDVLCKHEGTLRGLFDAYAFGGGNMHDKLNKVGALRRAP